MKGNCLHQFWPMDDGVALANNSDDYYFTVFESRAEVDEFIERLRVASDMKWRKEKAPAVSDEGSKSSTP